jgi:hypothetical protein
LDNPIRIAKFTHISLAGGVPVVVWIAVVTASSTIPFSPATNRVFIRFKVGGVEVGATSVAVQS